MDITCPQCGKKADLPISRVNRAKRDGLKVYCSRKCSGLGRRIERSDTEKKALKAEYDKQFRKLNKDRLKKEKHEYFKTTYNPAKAAIERKKRMPKHIEYCRQPAYKEKKRAYDARHRSESLYGDFWECHRLVLDIEKEYEQKEVREINNLHNKAQKRKRKWKQLNNLNYLRVT